jgi:hypothetical protein
LCPPENQILFFSIFDEMIGLPKSQSKILQKPVFGHFASAMFMQAQLSLKY